MDNTIDTIVQATGLKREEAAKAHEAQAKKRPFVVKYEDNGATSEFFRLHQLEPDNIH